MSEETRRKAIEADSEDWPTCVDALTAHMRDELAPKPQPGPCSECGSGIPDKGHRADCSKAPWKQPQPEPATPPSAKAESWPGPPGHYPDEVWLNGQTAYADAPPPGTTRPRYRRVDVPPSAKGAAETITLAPHPQLAGYWVETRGGKAFIPADVVEQQVAEARDEAEAEREENREVCDVLGAEDGEPTTDAARRVVGERNEHEANAASLESTSRLLRSDLNAALAKVRELTATAEVDGQTIVDLNKRVETAERELSAIRALEPQRAEAMRAAQELTDRLQGELGEAREEQGVLRRALTQALDRGDDFERRVSSSALESLREFRFQLQQGRSRGLGWAEAEIARLSDLLKVKP